MYDLTAKIVSVMFTAERKPLITLEFEDRSAALEMIDALKGLERIAAKFGKFRKKRSLDANAYAWVLIGKLAAAMHIKPVDVYRQQIPSVGDNYTPMCVREKDVERFIQCWEQNGIGWITADLGPSQVPGCRNLLAYHGSSTYDTAQMSRLIDNIVQDCKALGIETLPPEKLALLKEEWH